MTTRGANRAWKLPVLLSKEPAISHEEDQGLAKLDLHLRLQGTSEAHLSRYSRSALSLTSQEQAAHMYIYVLVVNAGLKNRL